MTENGKNDMNGNNDKNDKNDNDKNGTGTVATENNAETGAGGTVNGVDNSQTD